MSGKRKEVSAPTLSKKRGYVSWTDEMETIMIEVLHDQVAQGNKADGGWKLQVYQAVVDEIRNKLDMALTTDHVKNHIKIWKNHYGVVSEIRSKTKFN